MYHHITDLPAADSIRFFSIEMGRLGNLNVYGFVQVLLLLPKLVEIELFGCRQQFIYYSNILDGLCKYIKKYKSSIHLKKLTVCPSGDEPVEDEDLGILISLLILCTKYQIHFTQVPCININKFLALKRSQILPSLQHRPLFTTTLFGKLTFWDQPLKNLDRLKSLNIQRLELTVKRSITKNDVGWIRGIKSFQSLTLAYTTEPDKTNLQPSIAELELIMLDGFPSVTWLKLKDGILDPIRAIRWSQYFPNLQTLIISTYKTMPTDFISQLTSLEYLSMLIFSHVSCLNDIMFTAEQVNRFAAINGAAELALAIACFKLLRILRIRCCNKLTGVCLINGIAYCTTLEELKITFCGHIKEESLNQLGHNFSCKDVSINNNNLGRLSDYNHGPDECDFEEEDED